ncbi:MAG: FtsX-like permease family protein [Rhodothermales bacterium]
MPFAPTFAWRDSRSARRRLLLFVASMALGVAALVAIRSFADSLETAVTEQAQTLTGSDLTLSARRPFANKDRALVDSVAQAYPGEQSRELAFASMAFFPATGNARLTEIRALDGGFPYYGEIATTPDSAAAVYQQRGEALVDASLLLQFDAAPGDSVRVGERTYRIAGAIDEIAGQTGVGSFVGPRVYVPLARLDTALVGFGSRVEYREHFLFDAADPDAVLAEVRDRLGALGLRGETATGAQEDWNDALGNLNRFLALVGFVALLLGGIGVASAITVYVRQKADTIATLRCLGATAGQTLRAYVLQAAALGLLGALLGAALGVAVQTLLPRVLGPFLPVDVDFAVSWGAVIEGVGLGLAVALVFALLPLVRIRRIPPLRAIRPGAEAEGRFDWLRGAIFAFIALGVAAFAWVQTGDWRAAVGFPLGVGAVLGLLALAAWATTAAVRRFFPTGWPYTARQGLANLYRPGNQTLVLMLTLGLGTFLITTLYLVQTSLLDQVAITSSGERPGLILFDIQPDQRDGVLALLDAEGEPALAQIPVVTMGLDAINGRDTDALRQDSTVDLPNWALRREYRSTYRGALVDSETLAEGTFVGSVPADTALVPISFETDLATDLGVGVGDRLTWNVQGVPVETVITSLRTVDWTRVQPNFFVVFPEGPLDAAPQFDIVLTRAIDAETSARVQRAVVSAYPNVSVVDVRLVLGLVEGVLGRVAFVLQFMALFSILTGLVVLAGAVLISKFQRVEESVLLRTLGASRPQVGRILFAEYLLLGLLAASVGVGLALIGGWALSVFAFRVPFVPAWGAVLVALAVVPALTVAIGLAGSRGVLRRPPLEVLRSAG